VGGAQVEELLPSMCKGSIPRTANDNNATFLPTHSGLLREIAVTC
jgi:hypothetical protein